MRKVYQALTDELTADGAKVLFALMGGSNQDLICDFGERAGRVVHARHESGVVGMADGYARSTGRPGFATVTAGPGLTNAGTALAVARQHRSPVLLVAGDVPADDVRNPQRFDQAGFCALLAGGGNRVDAGDQFGERLAEAYQALAAGRPYVLNLPADVQDSPAGGASSSGPPMAAGPADERSIGAAADLLVGACRPVVLAGRGAVLSPAGPALWELSELLAAPIATTARAKGLFSGHRLGVGVTGVLGDGRADQALADGDVVLAVGTSLHPLAVGASLNGCRVIQIDTDPATFDAELSLRGDAAGTVRALVRCVRDRLVRGEPDAVTTMFPWPEAVLDSRPYLDTDLSVDPRRVCAELERLLPSERRIVLGGGQSSLTAAQLLTASSPLDWTHVSLDFGAIGQALPVAIGACFADPSRRVYHVTADGELMMGLAELHTAVRYRLPLTVVVLNDDGFGQERQNLERSGRPTTYAEHPSPDFVALARSLGAVGHRIGNPDDLDGLESMLSPEQGTVVIDVRINREFHHAASGKVARAITRAGTVDLVA